MGVQSLCFLATLPYAALWQVNPSSEFQFHVEAFDIYKKESNSNFGLLLNGKAPQLELAAGIQDAPKVASLISSRSQTEHPSLVAIISRVNVYI